MAVYDVDGNVLTAVYDIDGSLLTQAYDVDGNPLIVSDPDTLKVMTYNPQWFTKINSQQMMQSAIINNNNADIIGFQEFSKTTTIPSVASNALANYSTLILSNHYNYNAVASKYALSDMTIADFSAQDSYESANETRCYMKSYITIGTKRICWINTHLCYHSNVAQYAQMAEVFDMAQLEDYVIITGDFNSWALSINDDDYIGLFKPFVDARYNLANSTALRGFTKTWGDSTTAASTSDLTYPTDNIITSRNILIDSVTFDTTKFSYLDGNPIDHIPVIAELSIY